MRFSKVKVAAGILLWMPNMYINSAVQVPNFCTYFITTIHILQVYFTACTLCFQSFKRIHEICFSGPFKAVKCQLKCNDKLTEIIVSNELLNNLANDVLQLYQLAAFIKLARGKLSNESLCLLKLPQNKKYKCITYESTYARIEGELCIHFQNKGGDSVRHDVPELGLGILEDFVRHDVKYADEPS
jgi:hypothetical protein